MQMHYEVISKEELKSFDDQFKIVLAGDSGVGKSNLIKRLNNEEFQEEFQPNKGVEFSDFGVRIEN